MSGEGPQTPVRIYKTSHAHHPPFDLDDSSSVGSDTGPEVGTLLGNGSSDGRSLHLSLGVNNDTAACKDNRELEARTVNSEDTHALSSK